jgi:large subunit ribosomal protein L9e
MKYIHSEELLEIPEGVKVSIKTRNVVVEGPRGKLTKSLGHLAVSFTHPKKNLIKIELHHGSRKSVATIRTVRTLINNLIIGVTKGYKYKMRYVYAQYVTSFQPPITGAFEEVLDCNDGIDISHGNGKGV